MTFFAHQVRYYTGKLPRWVAALCLFALAMLAASGGAAQDAPGAPAVITAENVLRLRSVARIDFAHLPEAAGRVDSGWFAVSDDGERYAALNRAGGVVLWDLQAGYLKTSVASCSDDGRPGAFVDGVWHDAVFVAVYASGQDGYIGYHPAGDDAEAEAVCDQRHTPVRVWVDADGWNWFERLPFDTAPYVTGFPLRWGCAEHEAPDCAVQGDTIPSGPENDREAFVRIGRIEPPLAITVTQDGLVKRWNLQTGEVTASAQVGALPVSGQVNYGGAGHDGRYFAWVDDQLAALHLLDFETGDNQSITELNGKSVPFLWLASGADVAIGVHLGYQPRVTAWHTASGALVDLGMYRECSRPPDMVRLSRDGTTLVIGCDAGLDIWRVVGEE